MESIKEASIVKHETEIGRGQKTESMQLEGGAAPGGACVRSIVAGTSERDAKHSRWNNFARSVGVGFNFPAHTCPYHQPSSHSWPRGSHSKREPHSQVKVGFPIRLAKTSTGVEFCALPRVRPLRVQEHYSTAPSSRTSFAELDRSKSARAF